MSATCETCRWCELGITKQGNGLCRRNTPVAVVAVPWAPKMFRFLGISSMQWAAQWPIVEPDDWCGEHQPLEDKTPF